jgi:hypothetical protein
VLARPDKQVTAMMVRWVVRLHVLDLRGISERHSATPDTATKTVDV